MKRTTWHIDPFPSQRIHPTKQQAQQAPTKLIMDETLSLAGSTLSSRFRGITKKAAQDDTASNIRVLVRVRPLNQSEISGNHGENGHINVVHMDEKKDQPSSELTVRFGSAKKRYAFDAIHGPNSTQREVFQSVKDIIDAVADGYNGTIMAYGQTSSGKTHTVFGHSEGKNGGESTAIMPQSLRELFQQLDQAIQTIKEQEDTGDVLEHGIRSAKTEFTASFYEILNEQIFDLLTPQSLDQALSIREDVGGLGVYVEGLREVEIKDPESALQIFRQGIANRHVASTKMNRTSSRSHAVFVLKVMSEITTYRGITKVKRSKLTVVDLAGSERQSKTGSMGLRLREAAQINKSLSTLGSVINALVDREGGKLRHVPFRDSKLTFLLRDSLGGNSKTCLIACVSPSGASLDETISTLNFAQRAKLIKNNATVNEDTKDTINSLQVEVERLMTLLQEKQAGSSNQKNYSDAEIEKAVATYKARAEQAEEKVKVLNNELAEKQDDVKLLARKLNELTMVRSINEKSRFEISSGELDIQEQTLILQEELVMLLRQIDTPSRASAALKLKSMDDKDEVSKIVQMEIARLDASSKALHKVKEVLEQRISEFMLSSNETQEEIDSLIKALNRLDGDIKMLEDKLDAKDKQYLEACTRAEKAEKEAVQLKSLVSTLQSQVNSPTSVIDSSLTQIPIRQPSRLERKNVSLFTPRANEGDFAMFESQLDSELDVLKKQIDLY